MMAGRDEWMEEAMSKVSPMCSPTMVDSEHPLFLLYTSGSTGKPKGVSLIKDINSDAASFNSPTSHFRSGTALLVTSCMLLSPTGLVDNTNKKLLSYVSTFLCTLLDIL